MPPAPTLKTLKYVGRTEHIINAHIQVCDSVEINMTDKDLQTNKLKSCDLVSGFFISFFKVKRLKVKGKRVDKVLFLSYNDKPTQ